MLYYQNWKMTFNKNTVFPTTVLSRRKLYYGYTDDGKRKSVTKGEFLLDENISPTP